MHGMTKQWHERSEADKRRINNWVKMNDIKRKANEQRDRLRILNKKRGTHLHDEVAVIHYVEDTPRSLTMQFIRWQDAKQRRSRV
jgi:hypothetical protein